MLRTGGPRSVHEGIVENLLDLVDDPLLQPLRVIRKLLMKRNRRHDRILVAGSNSLDHVLPEQFHQTSLDGQIFDHQRPPI